MDTYSPASPRLKTNISHSRLRKSRSGIATVVSTAIMIAAVSILGSVMMIWANSTLNAQQQTIGNDYEKNSNLLKERYVIEDVWLGKPPSQENHVYVTVTNIGDIAINIKQVKITALDSAGNLACIAGSSCQSGTSASQTVVPTNGVVSSKQTLQIDAANIDWDHNNSKSLDISVTTERGSMERIIWKVKD